MSEQDPLADGPILPQPQGDAARKGAALFRRLMTMQADNAQAQELAPTHSEDSFAAPSDLHFDLPHPDSFGGGRRYDKLLAAVRGLELAADVLGRGGVAQETTDYEPLAVDHSHGHDSAGNATDHVAVSATDGDQTQLYDSQRSEEVTAPGIDVEALAENSAATQTQHDEELPAHPPHGAPMVRPSAPAPAQREYGDAQETLEATASGARLFSQPDGSSAFEIDFKDEVFEDLTCMIQSSDAGIEATFKVQDVNTRRLLEGEKDRLRVALESRGLKVQAVRVEVV